MFYPEMQDNEEKYDPVTYDEEIQQKEYKRIQESNQWMERAVYNYGYGYNHGNDYNYNHSYNHGYNPNYNFGYIPGYYNQIPNYNPYYNPYYNQYTYNPFFPLLLRRY